MSDLDDLAALWRVALLTGMRRGEILGLRWADVDFERGILSVSRTLSRGVGGRFEFGQPKSAHGRRSIVLPKSVTESLRRHRVKQVERRLALRSAYADDDLVFADQIGAPIHRNTLRKHFLKLTKAAGVPTMRFHDMRHTCATLMLRNNVNPNIASERLGHANVGITLDRYSHVSEDMQRDAADGMDRLIGS